MGFEVFSRKTSRAGLPTATFTALGRVALNKFATRFLEKDAVEYVILLWDADQRKVGIRPITKRDSRAYRVSYGTKGNGAGFSAKTFFDFIQYDYSITRNFPIDWVESEGMLILEIPPEHFTDTRQKQLLSIDVHPQKRMA